jgi:hypothetical protein
LPEDRCQRTEISAGQPYLLVLVVVLVLVIRFNIEDEEEHENECTTVLFSSVFCYLTPEPLNLEILLCRIDPNAKRVKFV